MDWGLDDAPIGTAPWDSSPTSAPGAPAPSGPVPSSPIFSSALANLPSPALGAAPKGSPLVYDPNDPGPLSSEGVPLAPLILQLEGSGQHAVSPKGAVGNYQIMPETARLYGFDPGRLQDPAYNRQAGLAIIDDLNRKFGGDADAVVVKYNASTKAFNRWLAAGRDPSVLPVETQKYLAHAHAIMGLAPVAAPAQVAATAAPSGPSWGANDAPVSGGQQPTWGTNDAPVAGAPAPPSGPSWGMGDAPSEQVAKSTTPTNPVEKGLRDVAAGAVEAFGQIVHGFGQAEDVGGQNLQRQAAGGFVTDPESGAVTPVSAKDQARAQAAIASGKIDTSGAQATAPFAAAMGAEAQKLSPWKKGLLGNIAVGGGAMAPGLVAAVASLPAGAAAFYAQGFNQAHDEAIAAGKDEATASRAGVENGLVQAGITAIPAGQLIGAAFKPLVKAAPKVVQFGVEAASHAGGTGVVMGAAQAGSNVVAAANYDRTRPGGEGVLKATVEGALMGGAMHGAGAGFGAAKRFVGERLRPREGVAATTEAPASPMPDTGAVQAYAGESWGAGDAPVAPAPAEQAPTSETVAPPPEPAAPPALAINPDTGQPFKSENAEIVHRLAGALPGEFEAAQADVAEYRSAAPKDYGIFQAIKDLGGMRVKEPDGSSTPGPDVQGALEDVKRKPPGMINNKSGMSPEQMHEALQEQGWFGQGNVGDEALVDAIRQEATGEKFTHPDSESTQQLARRHLLDRDMSEAGVIPTDSPALAAAKLAQWRTEQIQHGSLQMETLRARADALGVPHDAATTPDELLYSVLEREAIRAENNRSEIGDYERQIDQHLTAEDLARLDEYAREGLSPEHGESGAAFPLPEGWEFEPPTPEGYSESAPGAEGGGAHEAPSAAEAAAALTEHVKLAGETAEQHVMPGMERSARQAAAAREGALKPKAPQEEAGGLFAEPETAHAADLFEKPKVPEKAPERPAEYGSTNKVFTREDAEKARETLKRILNPNRLNAGIDPALVQAGITLAGYHIESGAREFHAYAKAMLGDLGEGVRPYLKSWYEAVRHYPEFEAHGMTPEREITPEAVAAIGSEAPSEKPEVTPRDEFRNQLDQRGAATGPNGESVRVLYNDATRGHSVEITRDGMRETFGGGYPAAWTREKAIQRGLDEVFPAEPPAQRIEAQAATQGDTAAQNAALFVSAKMPITEASPAPEPEPEAKQFVPGEPVLFAPDKTWQTPHDPGVPRRVVDVSDDGRQITLDGGVEVSTSDIEHAPATSGEETSDGLQGAVSAGDGATGAAADAGTAPDRKTGRLRSGSEPGSASVPGAGAGERAEGAERAPIGPAGGTAGTGTGDGADAGVSGAREGSDAGTAGRSPDAIVKGENFVIGHGEVAEARGPKVKARDNLEAIRLAKQIIADGRVATREEQAILAKYVGWGGLSGAFKGSDGKFSKGFEDVAGELSSLLTPDEYRAASRSTQYAHYTAEHVIRGMWKAVADMGFKGGSVLEPGMGVGHFLGMAPPDLAAKMHYQGIEMDPLTADIAKLLYPQSGVTRGDFTRTPMPENAFDLAIGNPPFSDTVIKADPKYSARNFMLHDYFFAKSIDSVRPGGLLAFVTSAGTMNKMDRSARRYLAQRAEFQGGVRLPSDAFRQNAGTDVTTDILFFKKRDAPVSEAEAGEPWTETTIRSLPDAGGGQTQGHVNSYFSDHPEQVLGQEGFFDKLYKGRYAVHALPGVDSARELRGALDRLPKNVMDAPETPGERAEMDFAAPEHKDGSFYVQDGKLMQYSDGVGRPVAKRGAGVEGGITAADQQRIAHLVPIRDALRDVFHHDLAENAAGSAVARTKLNAAYDAFVAKFGPINKAEFTYRVPNVLQMEAARAEQREAARDRGAYWREGDFDAETMLPLKATLADAARARAAARDAAGAGFDEGDFDPSAVPLITIEKRPNIAAFMDDPESYRLRAIEDYNDATGAHAKKDIFRQSVVTREVEPKLNSANDGVMWSLNKFGRFDLDSIAKQMGREKADLLTELGDRVFRMPGTEGEYRTSDEYLSGDVYDKLAEAQAAAVHDPEMRRNVQALEAALPPPLAPSEISMRLGMPWIPAEHIEAFARDGLEIGGVKVRHNPALGGWIVGQARTKGRGEAEWSTADMESDAVLTAALNRTPIRVYKDAYVDGQKTRVFDPLATQAAVDKVDAMKQKFDDYVRGDPEREAKIADIYNDAMNRTVLRKYDGSYLTTPGVSADWSWRPHQQRVVARIVQSGNTYMAHAVGAGKTSAMIGAGMEMRRLGLVRKNMYVVPNHMLGQFTKEFYEQYPTARIAVADERRFHTSRRKQFIANVAQDDLDAVIITHSAFGKIPVSDKFQQQLIQEQVSKIDESLDGLDKRDDRITVKKLENLKEKLEQRLVGAMGKNKDQTNTFEELGVDHVFVDEAHLFRKLSFATRQSMKGIDPNGSEMAWDLYSKVRYLDEQKPGRAAVLASGTPVTNTMGELYTLSRYLQPQDLARVGIDHFDSWSSTYGDTKTSLEQLPDGSYAPVTRFAKFVNMPELYKMVGRIMDVVTPAQLEEYVVRPKLEGGARIYHLAPSTEVMKAEQAKLAARMTAIKNRSGPPQKGDDIILSVINDGRLSAIDPRFVDPHADPRNPSKLNEMIDNVHRIWSETKNQQFYDPRNNYETPLTKGPATQMIFANLGVNPRAVKEGEPANTFSTYSEIKKQLLARGVPASEIAFIGDYSSHVARQKLFNDMNDGKVRILVGSTQKMGTGVNAQKRLFAVHNLDPLWFPADDEQRVGRILRQGNLNKEIQVHDYSTKGTYDATMWQMMGNKARFIEQFFRGDPDLREMDDLGEASHFEQASAMATTDERLITLTDLRQQLDKAIRRRDTHEREQYSMISRRRLAQGSINENLDKMARVQADIAKRVETRGDEFSAKVAGKTITERNAAADALEKEYHAVFPGIEVGGRAKIGQVGGFDIGVYKGIQDQPKFELYRSGGPQQIGDSSSSMKGVLASVERRLPGFEAEHAYLEGQNADHQRAIESINNQVGKPFTGAEEIESLRTKAKALEGEIEASNAGAKTTGAPELPQEPEPSHQPVSPEHRELMGRINRVTDDSAWPDEAPKLQRAPIYYSAVERQVDNSPMKSASPEQWKATLKNAPGIKREELEWLGVDDYLDLFKGEKVPKEALQAFIRDNGVKVEEHVLGEKDHGAIERRADELFEGQVSDLAEQMLDAGHADSPEDAEEQARKIAGGEYGQFLREAEEELSAEPQFEDWKTPGGQNYRELLLTLPSEANPPATHWDTPGVMAHVRFDERTDAEGRKVLFVQEIQSDWHQKGRDQGYAAGHDVERARVASAAYEEAVNAAAEAGNAVVRLANEQAAKLSPQTAPGNRPWNRGWNDAIDTQQGMRPERVRLAQTWLDENIAGLPFEDRGGVQKALNESFAARLRVNEVRQALSDARKVDGIPNAPFKSSWPALVMKRVIRWAVDHGMDKVAWTNGDEQAERYGLSEAIDSIHAETRLTRPDDRLVRLGNRVAENRILEAGHGEPYTGGGGGLWMSRAQMHEVFGKDLGERVFSGATENGASFEGGDLKIGGEGMRAFYDRNLVNITNDLIKKYGTKVERTALEHPDIATLRENARVFREQSDRAHNAPPGADLGAYGTPAYLDSVRERADRAQAAYEAARTQGDEYGPRPSFEITDKMREAAQGGFPLFNRPGERLSEPRMHPAITTEPVGEPSAREQVMIDRVAHEIERIAPFAEAHAFRAITEATRGRPESVYGMSYRDGLRRIIGWSLEAENPIGTARHEAVHALRSAGMIDGPEWEALSREAVSDDWMDRYKIGERYPDLTPEQQIEEAVAERYAEWNRAGPGSLPEIIRAAFAKVRQALARVADVARQVMGKDVTASDVLSRIESGDVGSRMAGDQGDRLAFARKAPTEEEQNRGPRGIVNRTLGRGVESVGRKLQVAAERSIPDPAAGILDEIKMGVSPMGMGSVRAQAAAKDFANALRQSAFQWGKLDEWLAKNFDHDARQRMWNAADEHGVLLRRGVEPGEGQGLNKLSPKERETVLALQERADAAYAQAQKLGMTTGEGLESYVPRMVVQMTISGPKVIKSATAKQAARGGNLSTTTGQLRQRKYETVEETQEAAQKAFGPGANVVRDIRTLGLATQRLEQAIAGRTLVDKIKAMSKDAGGGELVVEGANPDPGAYFTLDHPALRQWGPKFVVNKETGKFEPVRDQNGDMVFEANPVWVSNEFRGPLNAVLSAPSTGLVRALMDLKGKMMSVIMYSPLMHNAVIWGKAIPADPRGVLTLGAYRRGNLVRKSPEIMNEAIGAGMDPIGHRYFNQDLAGIAAAEGQDIVPGRSWTSQLIGAIPGFFDKEAGDATKRAIDKFGDVWHNTFLWDRVADLQAGLYVHIRDQQLAKGMDPLTAQRIAAHFANRYAGALPMESMSKMARTTANLLLFSRSFTLGNLAVYKDIAMGLPSDVRAQIEQQGGLPRLEQAQGAARQKAIGLLVMDVALQKFGLALAAAAAAGIAGTAVQWPWQNEPGKEDKFLIGYQPDGTAIYGRLPTGKVAEDMMGWIGEPREKLLAKLSPYARLMYAMAANDKGFGQHLYDPYDKTPLSLAKNTGRVLWFALEGIAPTQQLQGAANLATGQQDAKSAALQAFLPMTGITVAHGAPGGPAMSDMFAVKDEQQFKWQEQRPAIVAQIKAGDIEGARQAMTALGVAPGLQSYQIRVALNPATRMSKREVMDFYRSATPEQRARFEQDRQAMSQRASQLQPQP